MHCYLTCGACPTRRADRDDLALTGADQRECDARSCRIAGVAQTHTHPQLGIFHPGPGAGQMPPVTGWAAHPPHPAVIVDKVGIAPGPPDPAVSLLRRREGMLGACIAALPRWYHPPRSLSSVLRCAC